MQYADTDLKCWMDVEAWRRIAPAEERKRDQKAKDIKKSYLNKKYFFGPNSPAGKEGQDKVTVVAVAVAFVVVVVVVVHVLVVKVQRFYLSKKYFFWPQLLCFQ